MLKLGVNIDHVATVRQARLADEPSPVEAALIAENAGAWGITAHLREDRRHIQDCDMTLLKEQVKFLNMEMAVTDEMVSIASALRPNSCCLVPEKREELTTEGDLKSLTTFTPLKMRLPNSSSRELLSVCLLIRFLSRSGRPPNRKLNILSFIPALLPMRQANCSCRSSNG